MRKCIFGSLWHCFLAALNHSHDARALPPQAQSVHAFVMDPNGKQLDPEVCVVGGAF